MARRVTLVLPSRPARLASPRRDGALARAWRTFHAYPAALAGAAVALALVLVALIGPRLTIYEPDALSYTAILAAPTWDHPLGTDQFGRDIVSRIVHGAHLSLGIGFISVGIGATIGSLLGLLAGYSGGWTDHLIMRLIDIKLAFPGILLAIAIVSVLGPSLQNAMIAVGISAIPGYTRVVRGAVLSVKAQPYVEAARCVGCADGRIMLRHVLPNVLAPIIVLATLGVPSAILTAAGLSFIGLGAQPPTPEWGAMLNDGRQYLTKAWWLATFPGLAIMLAVMAINLLGDGLRDALDPRLRL